MHEAARKYLSRWEQNPTARPSLGDVRDGELGAGGRNRVGRNVLDILYRAASKTFQSTLILRRLFQVHKSLTDFDLAYRAQDTYIELIERDRARAASSPSLVTLLGVVFESVASEGYVLCSLALTFVAGQH